MEFIRKMFGLNKKKTQERVKSLKREELESASSSARKVKRSNTQSRKDMEYSGDIYKYLRRVESFFAPKCSFLQDKDQFRRGERQKAVEWMLGISTSFSFKRETLNTSVSLFDRYVELKAPKPAELGLLALTCVFVAYKYEEVAYLYKEVLALRSYQGETHEAEQVYAFEMDVLTSLGWRLSHIGAMSFFDVLDAGAGIGLETYEMAQAVAECLLLSGFSTCYQSSLIGAAIYWLALKAERADGWTVELAAKSLYTEKQVTSTAVAIVHFLKTEKDMNERYFCFGNTSYKIEKTLETLQALVKL